MSIKIRNAMRKCVSRAAFCLLILLPMGAVMAASKSVPRPNPFLQNLAQPGHAGPYTTQNGVVTQSVAAAAVQDAGDATSISASAKNATPRRGMPQRTGGGGL